jgi:threonine/homoserine/homoserine lactone efflux protein
VLFAAIALTTDTMYALLADLLAGKLRRSGTGAKLRRWISGGIFIALGVTAATARRVS